MRGLQVPFLCATFLYNLPINCKVNRRAIIESFNPYRNSTLSATPMQLGNGNFAFNADITGLQTIQPFNILSSWGWHNSSLPTTLGQTSPSDISGVIWWTHGRFVHYDQPNPAQPEISQWLISNPHRINLGRIGLLYQNRTVDAVELSAMSQRLDLYTGVLYSSFSLDGIVVSVQTVCDPRSDTVAFSVTSQHLSSSSLGIYIDFPYATDQSKFAAPYVGIWSETDMHRTTISIRVQSAQISHELDETKYFASLNWTNNATASHLGAHRYGLHWHDQDSIAFSVTFSPESSVKQVLNFRETKQSSQSSWRGYWETGNFIDCTNSKNEESMELQRRIILSQYLLAINAGSIDPPQESGLVNNGWYGKFHLEMSFWHLAHWGRWNQWKMFSKALPSISPGAINSLLIWQQSHPIYFAEMEYRAFPNNATLAKWDRFIVETANFMVSYAFWNESTHVYDLGPPLYPVSENTNPNQTINPTFELAYWRLGLDIAVKWQERQGRKVDSMWTHVARNLAAFPVQDDVLLLYEGVQNMWTTPKLRSDHPAFLGISGWLPPPSNLNKTIFNNTVQRVYETWNLTKGYGWDFPLLAMTAIRTGDTKRAVDLLLHKGFEFDDVGMPKGDTRVRTPYFPSSGGLLLAVALMAGGWDGAEGSHFPMEWQCEVEGFAPAM